MKAFHVIVFCAAGLIMSACGNKENAPAKDISAPAPQAGISIPAAQLGAPKDLVCGMPIKDGGIADTAVYDGKTYGFCSTECKDEFKKEPSKYLTQK